MKKLVIGLLGALFLISSCASILNNPAPSNQSQQGNPQTDAEAIVHEDSAENPTPRPAPAGITTVITQ